MTPTLSPGETALARSRAYTLYGRLFRDGLTPQLWVTVQAIGDLATALPGALTPDEAAAEHYRLFHIEVLAYESVFRGEEAVLGGAISRQVSERYRALGFAPAADVGAPDHLGVELALLAFLCGGEADAWAQGLPGPARRMRREQRSFLESHLLPWLAPVVLALRRAAGPFFTVLADLTLETVAEHFAALAPEGRSPLPLRRPDLPPPGEDAASNLQAIAHFLTLPAGSGLYLSRHDMAQIGRGLHLPRGFGGREQTLHTLLRSAAQYDALPDVLDQLTARVGGWWQAYDQLAEKLPVLAPFLAPWQARTEQTEALLRSITDADLA